MRGLKKAIIELLIFLMIVPLASIPIPVKAATAVAKKFEVIDKSKAVNIAADGELLDKRTQFSKIILKPDGSKEMQTSLAPINYQAQVNGKTAWQSIDSSLVATTTRSAGVSKTTYQNKANSFKVNIGQDILTDGVAVSQDGVQISLKPQRSFGISSRSTLSTLVNGSMPNVPTVTKVTQNSVTQTDTSGISYSYKSINAGLKEDITLQSYPGKNVFYFDLSLQGLTYEKKDGTIFFYSAGSKTPAFYIPPSFAYDSNMNKPGTIEDPISYDVQTDISKNGDNYVLKLTLDDSWLKSSSRKYPVTIDPSITPGLNWGRNEDTYAEQYPSGTNTSDQSYLYAGWTKFKNNGKWATKGWTRTLLPFDAQDNLGSVKIQGARVTVYQRLNTDNHGIFARMTSDYSGLTATWDNQPAYSTDVNGNQNGCTGCTIDVDVTSFAKFWYENHVPTFKAGYVAFLDDQDNLTGADPGQVYFRQWLSQNTDSAPRLTVDFTDIGANYSFNNVHDAKVGDAYSFGVNVHNSGENYLSAGATRVEAVFYKEGQGYAREYKNLPNDLGPGGTTTVNFDNLQFADPGSFQVVTDIVNNDVGWYSYLHVPQGVANFTISEYPEYGASYQTVSVPSSVGSNTTINLPVNVQNLSRNDWGVGQYQMSYHWIDNATGDTIIRDGLLASFPSTVDRRGGRGTVNMQVRVPYNAGNYSLRLDMIQPGVTWFSDQGIATADYNITVTPASFSSLTRLGTESYYAKVGPVDLATGNMSYSSTDLAVGSNTGALAVTRSYNSNSPDTLYDQSSDGYVQNWIVNGPYKENDSTQRLDEKYISNEETIRPNNNSSTNGKVWFKATTDTQIPNEICGPVAPPVPRSKSATKSQSDNVVLDINKSLENIGAVQSGYAKNSVVYANTYVYSPINQTVQISVGADDGYKVLLNGQGLFSNNVYFGCYLNGGTFTGNLKSGWNSLMVKVSNENSSWKMSTKLTDTNGNAISGLKYSLDNQEIFGDYETLGKGWTANFKEMIYSTDPNNIYYRDSTGSVNLYTRNGDGSYVTPTGSTLVLTKNTDSTFSLIAKSGLKINFNLAGKISSVVDLSGNTLSYRYDTNGNCVKIVDVNRSITLAYSGKQLVSATDQLGNRYAYSYDSTVFPAKLVKVTDPAGNFYTYDYSPNGKLQTFTNKIGSKTTLIYTNDSKVSAIKDTLGNLTSFDYFPGKTQITDALGHKSTAEFDKNNLLIASTNAKDYREFYQYDGNYNLTSTTPDIPENDGYYYRYTYVYDANSNLIKTTDPLGATVAFNYNGNDLVKMIDKDGATTSYKYSTDGRRLLLSETDPKSNSTSYEYDLSGHKISIIDSMGAKTKSVFSADGDLTSATSPQSETSNFTYDLIGRKLTDKSPLGKITSYVYSKLSQLLRTTDAGGLSINYEYDKNGNKTREISPNGTSKAYVYDALDRLVKSIDETGATIQYVYDAVGNEIKTIDANGKETITNYDILNQPIKEQSPSGSQISVTYDRNSQPVSVTDPSGQTTSQEFDKSGNVTKIADSSTTATYQYNSSGEMTSARSSAGNESIALAYDQNNNVTGVTSNTVGSSAVVYNSNDVPVSIKTDTATTSIVYNSDGMVNQVNTQVGGQTLTSRFARDAEGKITSATLPNGNSAFYSYDLSNRTTQLTNRNIGKVLLSQYNYQYDAVSNVTAIKEARSGVMTTYSYDARNELIREGNKNYTYDPMGNRLTTTDQTGLTKYTYDTTADANRLLGVKYPNGQTIQYSYDAKGNITQEADSVAGTTNYSYDSDGYFIKAVLPDGSSVQYTYDHLLKLRTSRTATSATGTITNFTKFIYSGDKLVSEIDSDGKIQKTYSWDINEKLFAVSIPDTQGVLQTFTYVKDAKDDIVGLTDSSGRQVAEYTYDAWGNITSSKTNTGSSIPNLDKVNTRLYSSYWYDSALGLYFMKTRMYNSATGRFMSKDPLLTGGSPTSFNPYVYCDNSPLDKIDPSGKGFIDSLKNFASKVVQSVKSVVNNVVSAISTGINYVVNKCAPIVASIKKGIQKASDWVDKHAKAIITAVAVGAAVVGAVALAIALIPEEAVVAVGSAIATGAAWIATTGSAVVQKVYDWVGTDISAAPEIVTATEGEATQLHHVVPQYLGGPQLASMGAKLEELGVSYHQQITSAFRAIVPYGSPEKMELLKLQMSDPAAYGAKIAEICNQVYSQFPINSWPFK